ncbi:SAF domain protein [Catenulispora acidiphila DSM 44928]|uniref:SAF domain protein n=1 Tax=Catenulispora acidiphila (strain DSM 44928 / JCM 14897 / NBRC 102108 / NRRL B-24433 / ID139908) TaxID=479433 RepID=C7Q3G9_CATAD|nr:SAF domain protein [Catenulispora acidiphila DSM 44928]
MSRLKMPSRASSRVPTARSPHDAVRAVAAGRRRRVPYVVAGSMLVLGAVVVGAVAFVKVGGRVPVLVVGAPVQVGQVISADDLKVVDIAPGTLAHVAFADEEKQVVGQPAAVPLVPDEVLTWQLIGAASYPPAGYGVATTQMKAGAYPPHLVAGARVEVVAPASAAGAAAQVVASLAAVTEVSTPTDSGDVVVSVLADQNSAKAVSSATPGSLSLVLLPAGG